MGLHRLRTLGCVLAVASIGCSSCGGNASRGASAEPGSGSGVTQHVGVDGAYLDYEVERATMEPGEPSLLLDWLAHELQRNLAQLRSAGEQPAPYFLGYEVVTTQALWLEAQLGATVRAERSHDRRVDVDVRTGTPALDNSRVRSGDYAGRGLGAGNEISVDDQRLSLAQSLWLMTEHQYRDAKDAYDEVVNDESRRSDTDDGPAAPDFADTKPLVAIAATRAPNLERWPDTWGPRLEAISARLAAPGSDLESSASLSIEHEVRHHVTSEGTRVQQPFALVRLSLEVSGQADDGMALSRMYDVDVVTPEALPSVAELETVADTLVAELAALRAAPIAEPYTGPAVLEGPAAGVFFHEIFGHRLEGHRQKSDDEGQTFTDMIGEPVLPEFLAVLDDPTISVLAGTPLLGHYFVDNEGVASQPTALVEDGILKTFLMSRSVVAPFTASNGHGRRATGNPVVARQGNLIVNSARSLPEDRLRAALIERAEAQGKPYGLWFSDIDGGYTTTTRGGPQAFKVIPRMVYRVWTDGRPDELVRGVDIVGTPLSAFDTIELTGDRPGVFNGMCGAESGWVPVSAVSPSLLVSKLEIERAAFNRDRPPLLSPPPVSGNPARGAQP